MKNRFTIGEMSKLHSIPVKTLRYYDEIGLFKPHERNINTGYRYYVADQFEQLNTIMYLKALQVSLKDIKFLIENKGVDNYLNILEKERKSVRNQIEKLVLADHKFQSRIQELKEAKHLQNVFIPTIEYYQQREILLLEDDIKSNEHLELSIKKLEKIVNSRATIFIGKVGLIVSKEHLIEGEFQRYKAIFLNTEEYWPKDILTIIPESYWAKITYRGTHKESESAYLKLIEYIAAEGYVIAGDAYERTIIDTFIGKDQTEYLTEIQFPIKLDSLVTG